MAAPPSVTIPDNDAIVAVGVKPDGTKSGIALDADGKIITTAGGASSDVNVTDRAARLVGVVTGAAAAPLALNATLTGGTAQSIVRGGAKGATVAATITSTAIDADHQAADVAVKAALPAGTNVIGHIIADSGSTTAVTSLPALPTGSNTIGAVTAPGAVALALNATQTNGTQVSNPSPSTPSSSSAYESGRVLKASAGTFRSVSVQMSPALASGTYYAQLLTASATVPVDGAVTFLRAPRAIVHTIGAAETENFYEGDSGITFTVGCTVCVSSTQFTKTAVALAAIFDGSVL